MFLQLKWVGFGYIIEINKGGLFMKVTTTLELGPEKNNPRNSEGAFIRGFDGEILFAYSRYHGDSCHDHATCDIYYVKSYDEGKSWSAPEKIVGGEFFGVQNVMSVSAVKQNDGAIGFYYIIKENNMASTLGRSLTYDGKTFVSERCVCNYPEGYYVTNNDRIVRLKNGQLVAPSAFYTLDEIRNYDVKKPSAKTMLFLSDDDGKTWYNGKSMLKTDFTAGGGRGLQEPGIIERENDLYLFMRTGHGCQYESISTTGVDGFETVAPSDFSSPNSPMQIKEYDGVMYAVYNPIPRYNGVFEYEGSWGRTPIVIRKSTDGGKTWGPINTIAADKERGYCYPALFKTDDNHLLLGMCMGNGTDGNTLCRLGIFRLDIDTIE